VSRRLTIVGSVLAGALAAIAILLPVFLISWRFAVSEQRAELNQSAERMLQRADDIYSEATATLRRITATDVEPCSQDHILLMKRATTDDLYIENIAYTAGGYVRCNAYGLVEAVIQRTRSTSNNPTGQRSTSTGSGRLGLPGRHSS
jgi:sensor c-di-GMP phosphodiesterase-like protein